MAKPMDFPDTKIDKDPDTANYQNYLAWQAQTQQRRRSLQTQFNLYQCRSLERTISQVQYKEEAERHTEDAKYLVECRLSAACDCRNCDTEGKSRSNSDASTNPLTQTENIQSSNDSFTSSTSLRSSQDTTACEPSGKNSLITSPPPRSRHHKRRSQIVPR